MLNGLKSFNTQKIGYQNGPGFKKGKNRDDIMLHFFMKKQAREKNKIDIGIKELIY